jgi:hypothetical protein
LTVLYVHGWKHGASPDDGDRKAFTELINDLQRHYEKKQVLGVYVSWNASNDLGILDNLSFWSKKTVADRISQSGVVTRIVASIGALQRADQDKLDQFIAIGHSFGARILFSATSHPLITGLARAHPEASQRESARYFVNPDEYQIMAGSADSVILLNPAFEASMYTALASFCRSKDTREFPRNQGPLLISISTSNDEATEKWFPRGQWLDLYRGPEVTTTLGNFDQYRSHQLFRDDGGVCPRDAGLTESFAANGLCLERNTPAADDKVKNCPNYPFLVAGTTPDIIDGHNGIWDKNKPFRRWLFDFITALEAHHRHLMQRGN